MIAGALPPCQGEGKVVEDPAELLASIELIADRKGHYHAEAYVFVLQSLERVLTGLQQRRHISGEELLDGIREHATERFGPMAKDVLNSWRVHSTLDIGHVVFHLVEAGLLSKTRQDSLSDFIDRYDFAEVFEDGYFERHLP
jgi:uncharacterized repeat protein (TIGR04138 family)